jgi:hypothetical protein
MYTEQDLQHLEQFFKTVTFPQEIQLTECEKITEVTKFVNASLSTCRANMGVKTFAAAYDRLVTLKDLLSK